MITTAEIGDKMTRAYPRVLSAWAVGELDALFPLAIRANLAPTKGKVAETIAAVDELRRGSKEARGWGYTIHWKEIRSREFGKNKFPREITVDTLDDLLRLASCKREFVVACDTANRIRRELPKLDRWVAANIRGVSDLEEDLSGLIDVAKWFIQNPWPDCYVRQIPVAVDTKFVERRQATLRTWLDELLPASAIAVHEGKFARRFGLRDGRPHTAVRILDPDLQAELKLPFDELSLPLRSLRSLAVTDATVIIVENRTNLLTLPPLKRGLAIRGEGTAVTRLTELDWLNENHVVYWGDIDIEGFQILSSIRRAFPHVQSVMMGLDTLVCNENHAGEGNERLCEVPFELTDDEQAAFRRCLERQLRLEQEQIPQSYVDAAIARLATQLPGSGEQRLAVEK